MGDLKFGRANDKDIPEVNVFILHSGDRQIFPEMAWGIVRFAAFKGPVTEIDLIVDINCLVGAAVMLEIGLMVADEAFKSRRLRPLGRCFEDPGLDGLAAIKKGLRGSKVDRKDLH